MKDDLLTKTQRNYIKTFDAINDGDYFKKEQDEQKVFRNIGKDKDEMIIDLIRSYLDEDECIKKEVADIQKRFWKNFNL